MKITPIAGPSMGHVDTGSEAAISPSRKEAAKQAYLGKTGSQIPEGDTPQDPRALVDALNVRKIKMRTNYSTNRLEDEVVEDVVSPKVTQESAISDPNEVVEPEVIRPISPQFAALAKQRRELALKAQEIAAKEKALAERSTPESAIDLGKLKATPLAVLKEAGVTYEQLTEAILAEQSGQDPRIQALEAKVDAYEKKLDEKLSERDLQAEKQVMAEIEREAERLVESAPEEFELVRGTNSKKKIPELIHRLWKKTGEVIDVSEAAKIIEDQLVEDNLKVASFGKIRSKLAPEVVQTPAQKPYGLRTLTNRDTAQRPLSARARAIAAMNGTLKR